MTMSPFPPGAPFPQSTHETVLGAGPDFPGSSGDREHGKFRPSGTPRLDTVAVVNDDGSPIGTTGATTLDENALLLRGILIGIQMLINVMDDTVDVDLIELAQTAYDE